MDIDELFDKNERAAQITFDDLYKRHKNEPQDGGPSFHGWQVDILSRISNKIADDEEALVLFNYLLCFAHVKACCAGD